MLSRLTWEGGGGRCEKEVDTLSQPSRGFRRCKPVAPFSPDRGRCRVHDAGRRLAKRSDRERKVGLQN